MLISTNPTDISRSLIVILLFSLLLIISCKKDKPTILEGNVQDCYTQSKVSNVVLHIAEIDMEATNPQLNTVLFVQSAWVKEIPTATNSKEVRFTVLLV